MDLVAEPGDGVFPRVTIPSLERAEQVLSPVQPTLLMEISEPIDPSSHAVRDLDENGNSKGGDVIAYHRIKTVWASDRGLS